MTARSILAFAIVVMVWGTTWIVIKSQLVVTDPAWSVAFRFAIAGAVLLAWCAWRGEPLAFPWPHLRFLLPFATLQFVLNFNFVYRAELYIPSGFLAVAFALLMIPNAVLARLFLGRRASGRFLAGSALAVLGVALLFGDQLALPADRADTLRGLGLGMAAVLSASIANVMQAAPAATRLALLPGLAWAMLVGAGLCALAALATAGPPLLDPRPVYWLGLVYLGVMASAVAFALYFDLVRSIGPAEAAWTGVPIPILAMAISTFAEGYRWTAAGAIGSAVALVGLVVALKPARRPAVQA